MFETERLLIRPFVEADIAEIYRLVYADADVRGAWSSFDDSLEEFRERFRTGKNWRNYAEYDARDFFVERNGLFFPLLCALPQ